MGAGQVGGLGDGLGSEENSHAGGYSRIEECELLSVSIAAELASTTMPRSVCIVADRLTCR